MANDDLKSLHIVLPMKPLPECKTRLRERLPQRTVDALVLLMLRRGLDSAPAHYRRTGKTCEVVGGDDIIRRLAEESGAQWTPDGGRGLNGEASAAMQAAYERGCESALYLPGDLPLVRERDVFELRYAGRKLNRPVGVPAREGGGTNALLIPAGMDMPLLLGEGSYAKHREAAKRAGTTLRTMKLPGIMDDVDTAEDYERARRLSPRLAGLLTDWEVWLLEGMASPPPAGGVFRADYEFYPWRTR